MNKNIITQKNTNSNTSSLNILKEKIFNITPYQFFPLIRRKFLDLDSDVVKLSHYLDQFIENFSEEEKQICDLKTDDVRKIELRQKAYKLIHANEHIKTDNTLDNSLHEIVAEDTRKLHAAFIEKSVPDFADHELVRLVPEVHIEMVKWVIQKRFKGDEVAYIASIPHFFRCFSIDDRRICDDMITSDNRLIRRKLNKKKKELLLYSAQLLALVGKGRAKIITNGLVDYYKEEMQKAEDYANNHRLVSKSGKIVRFTSVEDKQKQKVAQILKISKALSKKAEDKGYTFSLCTLTLPPEFHPMPSKGALSWTDIKPSDAHSKLLGFWALIRSALSNEGYVFGEEIFGLQVLECHLDSCLHLHCLIYHPKTEKDIKAVHDCIISVQDNHNAKYPNISKDHTKRMKFDIKLSDGTGSGATYLFKYITKTHTNFKDMSDDNKALKNIACRFFYSCRGFNFFGVNASITKFNFLQANIENYRQYFNAEINTMFTQNDYYLFMTKYSQWFTNEYYKDANGKRKLLGVRFDMDGLTEQFKKKYKKYANYANFKNCEVLIEKKQYAIFNVENNMNFDGDFGQIKSVDDLDLTDISNIDVVKAHEYVISKQDDFDFQKQVFVRSRQDLGKTIFTVDIYEHEKAAIEKAKLEFMSKKAVTDNIDVSYLNFFDSIVQLVHIHQEKQLQNLKNRKPKTENVYFDEEIEEDFCY